MESTNKISVEDAAKICARLSGKNSEGEVKCAVSYMFYEYKEGDTEEKTVYMLNNAVPVISIEKAVPGFYTMEIKFQSCDDTELALFWGKLKEFKRRQAMEPDKDFVFFINLLELDTLQYSQDAPDSLFTINIMNPLMASITREVPSQSVEDTEFGDRMVGGNIVNLLLHGELVVFNSIESVDTQKILGEAMREADSERYLNEMLGWNEDALNVNEQ